MSRYPVGDLKRLKLYVDTLVDAHENSVPENLIQPVEKTLFEFLTPEFVYLLVNGETAEPMAWAADAAELREWLETDRDHRIWKVSRTDPTDSLNFTDDFARTWINDRGDFHEGFDDFLHKLGPWLSTYYDDLAREMYGEGQPFGDLDRG